MGSDIQRELKGRGTYTLQELEITKFLVDYEIPGNGSTSEHCNLFYFVISVDSSSAVECPPLRDSEV